MFAVALETLPLDALCDPHLILDADGLVVRADSRVDAAILNDAPVLRQLAMARVAPTEIVADTILGRRWFSVATTDGKWQGAPARLVRLLDITGERHEALAQRHLADAAQDVIDALPAAVLLLDATGHIIAANARWHIQANTGEAGSVGSRLGANYADECDALAARGDPAMQRLADGVRQVLDRRRLAFEEDVHCRNPANPVWYHVTVSALGATEGAVVQHLETTALREALLAEASATAHFRGVFEMALDPILLFDDAMQVLAVNAAAEQTLGRSRDALEGRPLCEFVAPESLNTLYEQHEALLAMGEGRGFSQYMGAGGKLVDVEFASRANVVPGRHVTMLRDRSAMNSMERQLRTAQRMEAIGRVTGGIAHDFNNLLTVIVAHAEILAGDPDAVSDADRQSLQEVLAAARRGAEMVRKLMALGRQEPLRLTACDIGAGIEEAATILRRILPETINTQVRIEGELPLACADANAVQEILLNLATNARDAMPDGGNLTITVRAESGAARQAADAARALVQPLHHVVVRVQDTGVGMDSSTLANLFEPFFTTKPPGQGTGLGMPMVQGLMEQMRGRVEVRSARQQGTTVTLHFAVADSAWIAQALPTPAKAHRAVHGETVLVVEDDPGIRALAVRLLEKAGYRVLEAHHGDHAWDVLASRSHALHGPIDVVLSDIVMPRGGGARVLDGVIRFGAGVRLIWMTGYPGAEFDDAEVRAPCAAPIIQKPWSVAGLLAGVRDALDGPPTPLPSYQSDAHSA
ncbi:MAG: PAS domain-containing protein [Gemmatimonadaceae bacterium]|nr:PAS domain-containing protein [Gemmatimonadaceae bacterium]